MSRFYSYLHSAQQILESYNGSMPFAVWLKEYFRYHKKFGSTDRKQVMHLCYCTFRLGKALEDAEPEQRILAGLFLCSTAEGHPVLEALRPQWQQAAGATLEEKLRLLSLPEEPRFFPLTGELSREIEARAFSQSHLVQPFLHLRIRPGFEKKVTDKLTKEGISFDLVDDTCLVLANNTKVEGIVALNKEVVVQDRSSQRVLDLLPSSLHRQDLKAWDCCAASGGKSILLWDQFSLQHLAVSDVRQSILHNLKSRFREAGISNYHSLVADLSGGSHSPGSKFDLVICDAPCSGSGTWGRTPEQLRFFTKEKIEHYTSLQQRIAGNASKGVKEGGYFLYITCSVFSKENEEVADHIQKSTSLQHVESRYFKGYQQKADTLFAALFRL